MRRLLILSFALLALIPARADALTVRDVVELARAGLGDDIILALIEVNRSVFPIDTATLKTLQAAGVGERVILAMIRSQRTQPAVPVADVTDAPEALAAAQRALLRLARYSSPYYWAGYQMIGESEGGPGPHKTALRSVPQK